jgi:hypothetical protein
VAREGYRGDDTAPLEDNGEMSTRGKADRGRFADPLSHIEDLAAENIDVVCPRCQARAVNAPRPVVSVPVTRWRRRLACGGCGYSKAWTPGSSVWDGPVDPFFRVPLWLRAECCGGHTLWAFNRTHLDLLEAYVAAGLRERRASPGCMSMLARLPAWMKAAKHRDEVVRTVRASLSDPGGPRS